jgi:hypothetical protein
MLRFVNDNKLGSRIICVPTDRETVLQKTRIESIPRRLTFFTENKTATPDFNSDLDVIRTIYTPNEDNEIYLAYPKTDEKLEPTYREYDWSTNINYQK